MNITNRPFDDTQHDFEKMWDFVRQDYARRQDEFIWLFSRLADWKYGLWHERKYFPFFFRNNAQLWFTGFQELVGFLLSEDGDPRFTVFTREGYEFLEKEILDWAVMHWKDRPPALQTEVREQQSCFRATLESCGFRAKGVIASTRKYCLLEKVAEEIKLDAGFKIVDMDSNGDYRGKRALQKDAFVKEVHVSDTDMWAYEYSRESPTYVGYYDLSVIDESGKHVAGCQGFVDYAYRIAEIERICTHREFRRKGLAEAVVRECFRRLHQHGIEYAYITGYSGEANGLYEKLGAIQCKDWLLYELA